VKHKILSGLYFNTIKNIGNLRLMFVISVICACVCLGNIYDDVLRCTYYFKISSNNLTPELIYDVEWHHLSDDDLETFYKLRALDACNQGDVKLAQQLYFGGYTNGFEECNKLVSKYQNYTEKTIYSFGALWNLLWMIFWFYFPFVIIFPIKFIYDGYQQFKKAKK